MKRIAAGLVIIGAIAGCFAGTSASWGASKPDPRLTWPKNSQFNCRGVLTQEQGTYRLTPDQGMLAWCDADIGDKDKSRVLNACKLGNGCEIRGIISGHGTFGWVEIWSATGRARAAQLPESYLGEWASETVGDRGITITQQQYHEPGYHCDIQSIQQVTEAATSRPIYLVAMRCSDEGPRPFLVREIWAMRKVGNESFLAIASVSGEMFPSINVLHRPK